MKCPKCGYLGFETSDRCRNCGYDFSLVVVSRDQPDLALQDREGPGSPFGDLDLTPTTAPSVPTAGGVLDLDRVIGQAEPARVLAQGGAVSVVTPPRAEPGPARAESLPLFVGHGEEGDDPPLITTPRPVRPPLAVRRATPDVPRARQRSGRVTPSRRDDSSALRFDAPMGAGSTAVGEGAVRPTTASPGRRLLAAAIDVLILAAIDLGVVYFTLAIAGVTIGELGMLPPIPFVAFLLIVDGGYVIAFTVASGQTIGKMAMRIQVVRDDNQRLTLTDAMLRAAGCAVSLATAGLGYVPAFLSADRRALQDRLAGTRVVEVL
jgi:uncharacterized RDD family membrane protein YckC